MSSTEQEFDAAFQREARIGMMVVSVLMAIFMYVAYGKLSGWYEPQPLAFQNQEKVQADMPDVDSAEPTNWIAKESTARTSLARPPRIAQDDSKPLSANTPKTDRRRTRVLSEFGNADTTTTNPTKKTDRTTEQALNEMPNETAIRQARPKPTVQQPNRPNPQIDFTSRSPRNSISAITETTTARSGFKPNRAVAISESGTPESRTSEFKAATSNPSKEARPAFPAIKRASAIEEIASQDKFELPGSRQIPTSLPGANSPAANAPSPTLAKRIETPQSLSTPSTPSQSKASQTPGTTVSGSGDSFWLVAKRVYGDGRYFDALYKLNQSRVDSFNELPSGTRLLTPPVDNLRERFPRLVPGLEIRTEGGETLFQIASEHLGQASRYVEILKLNYERLPKEIGSDSPLPANVLLELPGTR